MAYRRQHTGPPAEGVSTYATEERRFSPYPYFFYPPIPKSFLKRINVPKYMPAASTFFLPPEKTFTPLAITVATVSTCSTARHTPNITCSRSTTQNELSINACKKKLPSTLQRSRCRPCRALLLLAPGKWTDWHLLLYCLSRPMLFWQGSSTAWPAALALIFARVAAVPRRLRFPENVQPRWLACCLS